MSDKINSIRSYYLDTNNRIILIDYFWLTYQLLNQKISKMVNFLKVRDIIFF